PLAVSGQYSANQLVRDIFARGICNSISNISTIGPATGIGYFENGLSSIGLDKGIILSTGPITNAPGPNNLTDKSGDFNYNGGDPDLNLLANTGVRDRAGLEFDFVPLDSFVTFRYVFASEEYCEFVGSDYNDVFGFFISGPGIQGAFSNNSRNIALIPGSNDFVAINTVNHLQNAGYFIRNELPADALQCGITPQSSPFTPLIQYDGFTRKLTASLKLIPCETYHIRMVVADVGDNFYDSAVFLEAESFNIGAAVAIGGQSQSNASGIAYEGCNDGHFRFQRADPSSRDLPVTVRYSIIAAASTATEGVDFAPLPGIATIPAGQSGVNVPVSFFNDQILEGIEALIELNIKNPNSMGFSIYPSEFDIIFSGMNLGKAKLKKRVHIDANCEKAYTFELNSSFKEFNFMDITKMLSGSKLGTMQVKGDLKAGK
ncbi:MAG TPA: choice-of-anchor L domain-containing protein, partial [Saprospiraceae bacterium]|nr:choice-of-anchor L domain-containing protein [Saprospiraceae bacterium]